jgi:holo-[acyl-carrier protein] synthase
LIVGTGIDLVEMERIRPLVHNQKFIDRILTPEERKAFYKMTNLRRQTEYLAGRFAAKEAFSKALGSGIGSRLSWQDISVLNQSLGQPILVYPFDKPHKVHLSITHTKNYAAAFVIIEGLSG